MFSCYSLFIRRNKYFIATLYILFLSYTFYRSSIFYYSPKPFVKRRMPLPECSRHFPFIRHIKSVNALLYNLLLSYTFDCFPIRFTAVLYDLLLTYAVCCYPMLPNCFGNRTCGAEFAYNYLYCYTNIFIAHFNKK